jgi:hypothetical protein
MYLGLTSLMHCASVPNANKVVPTSVDVGVAVDVRGLSGSRVGWLMDSVEYQIPGLDRNCIFPSQ